MSSIERFLRVQATAQRRRSLHPRSATVTRVPGGDAVRLRVAFSIAGFPVSTPCVDGADAVHTPGPAGQLVVSRADSRRPPEEGAPAVCGVLVGNAPSQAFPSGEARSCV